MLKNKRQLLLLATVIVQIALFQNCSQDYSILTDKVSTKPSTVAVGDAPQTPSDVPDVPDDSTSDITDVSTDIEEPDESNTDMFCDRLRNPVNRCHASLMRLQDYLKDRQSDVVALELKIKAQPSNKDLVDALIKVKINMDLAKKKVASLVEQTNVHPIADGQSIKSDDYAHPGVGSPFRKKFAFFTGRQIESIENNGDIVVFFGGTNSDGTLHSKIKQLTGKAGKTIVCDANVGKVEMRSLNVFQRAGLLMVRGDIDQIENTTGTVTLLHGDVGSVSKSSGSLLLIDGHVDRDKITDSHGFLFEINR